MDRLRCYDALGWALVQAPEFEVDHLRMHEAENAKNEAQQQSFSAGLQAYIWR